MLFVKLLPEEETRLQTLERTSPKHHVRVRAKALLLSHQGHSRQSLAKMFNKRLDTISDWIHHFKSDRNWDLEDATGRGRKPKIKGEEKKNG